MVLKTSLFGSLRYKLYIVLRIKLFLLSLLLIFVVSLKGFGFFYHLFILLNFFLSFFTFLELYFICRFSNFRYPKNILIFLALSLFTLLFLFHFFFFLVLSSAPYPNSLSSALPRPQEFSSDTVLPYPYFPGGLILDFRKPGFNISNFQQQFVLFRPE